MAAKQIKILITGSGAPGIAGTVYSLRNNYDNRTVCVIGTDMKTGVAGQYLCDDFDVIPPACNVNNYLNRLLELSVDKKIDVILPQNTAELEILARNKQIFEQVGTKIIISSLQALELSNNKFNLMNFCRSKGIPTAGFFLTDNFEDLRKYAEELGWPDNRVVIKPPVSNGQRGMRIIDQRIDLKKAFYEQKPNNLFIRMDSLYDIIGDKFPELIVMEYLPGDEYTADIFRNKHNTLVVPRKRLSIRSGITFSGCVEKHEQIMSFSEKLAEQIDLEYCFGFQFKLDEYGLPKILESNPRVQGTMVLATFAGANIIYSSIKAAIGEEIPDFKINWNTKLVRYWGALHILNNEIIEKI
jgi:carbamoyl-phosphate synthase large subunit